MKEKIPPHSNEAEQAVLGSAMLSKEALADISEIVITDDFYDNAHKEIYQAIIELFKRNQPVDILTVCNELKKRGSLELAGDRPYVASLPGNLPTAVNAADYARIVAEKASIRQIIKVADEMKELGFNESEESGIIIDKAEKNIFEIAQRGQSRNYSHIKDVLLENMDMIDRAQKMGEGLLGVPSGFKGIDNLTNGFKKSELIIVGARPAMGKSAFALNIALNAAKEAKASVLIFNFEMEKTDLSQRLLSMEAGVEIKKIQRGTLDNNDWQKINLAVDTLSNTNIVIDDTPGISILEMRNKCRRMKAEHGLDLVVVDYLQLMMADNDGRRQDSRQNEISQLSRQLKILAREMECPVLVLSQLSRALEGREDKHPRLSDLRESGSIEQDADKVIFLFRDDYYTKEKSEKPNVCDIDLAKNRNGEIGRVELAWVGRYTRFNEKA